MLKRSIIYIPDQNSSTRKLNASSYFFYASGVSPYSLLSLFRLVKCTGKVLRTMDTYFL